MQNMSFPDYDLDETQIGGALPKGLSVAASNGVALAAVLGWSLRWFAVQETQPLLRYTFLAPAGRLNPGLVSCLWDRRCG